MLLFIPLKSTRFHLGDRLMRYFLYFLDLTVLPNTIDILFLLLLILLGGLLIVLISVFVDTNMLLNFLQFILNTFDFLDEQILHINISQSLHNSIHFLLYSIHTTFYWWRLSFTYFVYWSIRSWSHHRFTPCFFYLFFLRFFTIIVFLGDFPLGWLV